MSHDKDRLEIEYHTNPHNIQVLCPLAEVYLAENRIERAGKLIEAALKEFETQQQHQNITLGMTLLDVCLKLWKADRFASRGNVRLNISPNRRKLLEDIQDLCKTLNRMHDRDSFQVLSLKSAYVQECLGGYQDTLTILSDLITMQATEGVDLSYIIFKAAINLRHVNHIKQAIEYLEFVFDDPPTQGLNRLHVAAYMVTVYEISGEKYKVFLAKAYKDLINVITQEADPKVNGAAAKQYKRLENMTKTPTAFQSNAEFWEVMAFQALERCEYVLAAEFLTVGIQKSSNKGPMQHYLAEVLWLLGERAPAESMAEKAFASLPQSAELRNLLLTISPEKWTERIRFLSPTKSDNVAVSNIGDNAIQAPALLTHGASSSSILPSHTSAAAASGRPSSAGNTGGGLVSRLRNTAATALQVLQQASFRSNGNSQHSPSNSRPGSPNDRPISAAMGNRSCSVPFPEPIREEDENEKSLRTNNNSPSKESSTSPPKINNGKTKKQTKYDLKPSSSSSPGKGGRRPIQGKPLKPPPITDPAEKALLSQLQRGNANIHYYQPELQIYASIQRMIQREKEVEEMRKRAFAT